METSIDSIANKARANGLQFYLDPVSVPNWIRGAETACIVSPRKHEMKILGLGYSSGTGPNGITADVVVVEDFNELQERAEEVTLRNYKKKKFGNLSGSQRRIGN